ncbi:thioredoxin domain-containing protein [bacterium]|nr:thioredoxin domain-containing protein [Balneola sp.]MBR9916201.1 thioredoxin domain-containing protein [bacterium]
MKKGILLTLLIGLFTFSFVQAQESESEKEPLKITKFSDYQCPACKYYGQILDKAKEEFGDRIEVTYKNYPLRMHQHANLAARAAEAAKKQGKFIEMHELLFVGQEQWSRGQAEAIFTGYAKELGLDMDEFKADLNSARINRIVLADKREGNSLGVNSTPTFFINGEKVTRMPQTYEGFKALLESKMK